MNRSQDHADAGRDDLRAMTRGSVVTLQIIVIALITGICFFAGFIIWSGKLQLPPQGQFLSLFSVGMGALMAVLHVAVPTILERTAIANLGVDAGPQALLGIFVTRTIIAAALLEGAAMTSVAALMIEHRNWVLGVTATMLVLMTLQIPSVTRVEHWLELRMMERESRRG